MYSFIRFKDAVINYSRTRVGQQNEFDNTEKLEADEVQLDMNEVDVFSIKKKKSKNNRVRWTQQQKQMVLKQF